MKEKIRKILENGKLDWRNWATREKIDSAVVFVAVLLGIYFNWGIPEIIIFAIFIGIIVHPISSRYLAIPALFFLSITPFLLILKRNERAEEFVIYAYYFLIMAVIMGLYEIRNKENNYHGPA